MIRLNINDFRYKEWRELLENEYGRDYMAAVAKLSAKDAYTAEGSLKKTYTLTEAEHIALLKHHEEPYRRFLDDVSKYTKEVAELYKYNQGKDVTWEIVGVDYSGVFLVEKYGVAVYKQANDEVPYKPYSSERDFLNANRKLGHLVHEGISASSVIDLDLLQKSLASKGIPSYIDYEEKVFHFNAINHVKKKTQDIG